ncbi:hypothetical protein OR16_04207 [Cupriavidus basilensis OR16]|uniref:Uncharacterized protein n=1 Tax=Cupriavidus basilensis OR16 TaxID=1127483 RepID=H1RZT5_9BURK|nr:hypothetical protein [Cupriavidus basilensis]EHP44151.1 hypothetical protein OR16_04207 [Cupriavidus basilensis OR16]
MAKNIADNPAHRLHEILLECKNIGSNEPCSKAWQKILKSTDEAELLTRLGKLLDLAGEVVVVMESAFARHVGPLQQLRSQLYKGVAEQALNGRWSSFRSHLDDNAIVALGFAAALLDEREALRSVDAGSLPMSGMTLCPYSAML